jgi:predicted RNA binding protein YcfA (HicA-like mRNA interferase family)
VSKLPMLSGKEVCKALEAIGYRLDHQTGSHIILRNETPPYRRVTVPNHKEIAKGTLRAIIRQTGLTLELFLELLEEKQPASTSARHDK